MNRFSTHSLKSGVSNTYTHSSVSSGVTTRSLERTLRNFAGRVTRPLPSTFKRNSPFRSTSRRGASSAIPLSTVAAKASFPLLRFEWDSSECVVRFEIPLGRFPRDAYYPTMPHFATFHATFTPFLPHLLPARYRRKIADNRSKIYMWYSYYEKRTIHH